jgi:Tol biopolymer transport system component
LADGTILFESLDAGQSDLYMLAPKGGAAPRAYLRAPWSETNLQVSPDGRLGAFESNELGGRADIWIREFPTPVGKWKVSTGGGIAPRWSPDGQYLYFWKPGRAPAADTLFRARVDRAPRITVHEPERMLSVDILGALNNWDIHPDGKRVILTVGTGGQTASIESNADSQSPRYVVVLNWFSDLESLMKKGKQ